MWLVLIVMTAMAFCGCKSENKYADVKDEEFEKTGFFYGTRRREVVQGTRQSFTEYYYVVKNNSAQTVAIVGTAKVYGNNGEVLFEGGDDIPVLGPGETSVLKYHVRNADREHIDHVDCDLKYYKTDLKPVIGDIQLDYMLMDDQITVVATNNSDIEVQSLKGTMIFFDADHNVVATNEEPLGEEEDGSTNVLRAGVSKVTMFSPENYKTGLVNPGDKYPSYESVGFYLTYLDAPQEGELQPKSPAFIDATEDVLNVRELHCKDFSGYQHHILVLWNKSDQMISVRGLVTAYNSYGDPLTARTSSLERLGPNQEAVLLFDFDELPDGSRAGEALASADHMGYSLKYTVLEETLTVSKITTYISSYEFIQEYFADVMVYNPTGNAVPLPKVFGIFYDASGEILYAGYADWKRRLENSDVEYVANEMLMPQEPVYYLFYNDVNWFYDKETGEYRTMPKFDSMAIYVME